MAKLNTAIRGAQIADAVAGDGLEWTSDDVLGLDLKTTSGLSIDTAELKLDLNNLGVAVVDVAADSFAIIDADASNVTAKEAIADLVTAMAGTGLTATAGVLAVDDIATAVLEADILYENKSAECNDSNVTFTLAQTPLSNSVQVFLNGLIQEEGSGKDFTIDGVTITFVIAPNTGDIMLVHYIQDN